MVLDQGPFLPSRGRLVMSGDILIITFKVVLPASTGWRSRMLLTALQRTGQPSQWRTIQSKQSPMPARNPNLNQSHNNIFVKMGPFRYLLQLRVTLLWGCQNFESFKISSATKVPKLFRNFWVKEFFFSYCPLYFLLQIMWTSLVRWLIKSLVKSEFPISSGHRMLPLSDVFWLTVLFLRVDYAGCWVCQL